MCVQGPPLLPCTARMAAPVDELLLTSCSAHASCSPSPMQLAALQGRTRRPRGCQRPSGCAGCLAPTQVPQAAALAVHQLHCPAGMLPAWSICLTPSSGAYIPSLQSPGPVAVNASSWRMYKLGQPISPLEVVRNGSQAQHAVGDEGVSVDSADGRRRLFIRCGGAGAGPFTMASAAWQDSTGGWVGAAVRAVRLWIG